MESRNDYLCVEFRALRNVLSSKWGTSELDMLNGNA